jgi:phi LC3 family holin
MKINWRVRLKNKAFWLFIIPAIIFFIQTVASLFGYTLDLSNISNKLIDVVESAFVVLMGIGIVADPTTKGISDSKQALTYFEPKED